MEMPLSDFEWYLDRLETERKREHDAMVRANKSGRR